MTDQAAADFVLDLDIQHDLESIALQTTDLLAQALEGLEVQLRDQPRSDRLRRVTTAVSLELSDRQNRLSFATS
jgi:hypothetical protein